MTKTNNEDDITGTVGGNSFAVSKKAVTRMAEQGIDVIAALEAALKKGIKTVPKQD
jgi:hypothetical protein